MTTPLRLVRPPADAFPVCDDCRRDKTVLLTTPTGRYCRTCLFSAEKPAKPSAARAGTRTLKHGGPA